MPDCVEEMDGAHDVGGVGLDGDLVGETDEGLSGEVEDNLGGNFGDVVAQCLGIADVQLGVVDAVGQIELLEERGLGIGRKAETVNLRTFGE